MLGTIINTIAIILGGILGLIFKKGLPHRLSETISQGLGLGVMLIGITMAIKTENILMLLLSLLLGGIIGELINIEKQLHRLGDAFQRKIKGSHQHFSQGFVTASLLFCTGSMAIMGALEGGLTGEYTILLSKALLDGIFSIIFASTMGIGVLFAALPVFLYQGSITLLAGTVKVFLSPEMILEMNAVGGLLILAIGINMLKIKEIKVGNLLPAVFMPILFLGLISILGG
ncbi:MAG: DUF554 domain-containing protein [Eubacteriaceae bacterium]